MEFSVAVERIGIPALCVVLAYGVWCLPQDVQAILVYQRSGVEQGEYWRLWTAHLTHYSLSQLVVNVGMFSVLLYVLRDELAVPYVFLGWSICVAMPLVLLSQYLWVDGLLEYRGISALVAMLWVWFFLGVVQTSRVYSGRFFLASAALLGFILRMFSDGWQGATISELPQGVSIAWQAHLAGGCCGLFAFWLYAYHKKGACSL